MVFYSVHVVRPVPVSFVSIARDIITPVWVDSAGMDEMLMQVVNKFEDISFHGARYGNIVD